MNTTNDNRIVCKYGSKCYQKNPIHHEKYKHPPKRGAQKLNDSPAVKKFKISVSDDEDEGTSTVTSTTADKKIECTLQDASDEAIVDSTEHLEEVAEKIEQIKKIPDVINYKEFIKEKFLVEMPKDFYQFWDFCKKINLNNPQDALNNVGLKLIGPYDVLANKFCNTEEKSEEEYLIHWRYYYDPPEFQTVIKSDDKKGFHIGYFRDDPKMPPVFMASNYGNVDGTVEVMGPNIFASVYIYLEELKKIGDPFKKIHIGKVQTTIKEMASELNLELTKKDSNIRSRDLKTVTRTFNNAGLVVPYNRRSQSGYRELVLNNKDLKQLLQKIKNAYTEQMPSLLDALQPVLTYASIATDECDFGTGIELGWNLLFYGIDSLNQTIASFLENSYNLLNRKEFSKIAKAHMKNRRTGSLLSII